MELIKFILVCLEICTALEYLILLFGLHVKDEDRKSTLKGLLKLFGVSFLLVVFGILHIMLTKLL